LVIGVSPSEKIIWSVTARFMPDFTAVKIHVIFQLGTAFASSPYK